MPLKIFDFVKIPSDATFTVGSSGLLGDRFVAIFPPTTKPTSYLSPGAQVSGAREKGLDDITKEGGALIKDLRRTVAKVDIAVSKLNGDALSQANMDHLKETFDNLSKASASLSESSEKIGAVVEKAGGTMGSAKEAADKIQDVAGDAQKTVQAASRILNEATKGDGLVAIVAYKPGSGGRSARSHQ